MRFPFPLGLVFAISLSSIQALPPESPSPSPSPTAPAAPSRPPVAFSFPGPGPTRPPDVSRDPPFPVPPPNPAPILPQPPAPALAAPRSRLPSAAEIQQVTPLVEVWRANAQAPQVPTRHGNQLEQVFIAGTEPVMLRLQFHPLAAGKTVLVRAGNGAIVEVQDEVLRIQATGECILAVRLEESAPRGHVTFYCEGLTTTLSLMRAAPKFSAAQEKIDDGGGR